MPAFFCQFTNLHQFSVDLIHKDRVNSECATLKKGHVRFEHILQEANASTELSRNSARVSRCIIAHRNGREEFPPIRNATGGKSLPSLSTDNTRNQTVSVPQQPMELNKHSRCGELQESFAADAGKWMARRKAAQRKTSGRLIIVVKRQAADMEREDPSFIGKRHSLTWKGWSNDGCR
jgi:hypothetical protein